VVEKSHCGLIGECLLLSARDNVGADQPEALVAADGGPVLVVVGLVLILDETVLNGGEVEAPLPGAGGNEGGPGAVGLAE
jgi:hypothetical protein